MRILFLNQFFWPDHAATGQLLTDVADSMSAAGARVTVICGSSEYGGKGSSRQPDLRILRLASSRFSRNAAGRLSSYLSFLPRALWAGLTAERHDVVVTLTTPPMLSVIGMSIQKLRGARHVIWEMDVYPDIAVDLGMMNGNGMAARFFAALGDLTRRHADRVIVLGACMKRRLMGHGIPESKLSIAENWADCDATPAEGGTLEPPVAGQPLSVIYSGNLGLAHDVDTISSAMTRLDRPDEFRFVFAGGGPRYAALNNFCAGNRLRNAEFIAYCERAELRRRLASSHIGLVTQRSATVGSVVPSKPYGILAAGRPVLYVGPGNSTTAEMIDRYRCGWRVECGDVDGLVELLRRLRDEPELTRAAGARAFEAFVAEYQRSIGVARIASVLHEVSGTVRS